MTHRTFILGIFGPPGSGKSTVCDLLAERGFVVWRADDAVDELYQAGNQGAKRIGEYFGRQFLSSSGSVLKGRLAKLVVHNSAKFQILEHLIHPLVVNHAQHWIDAMKRKGERYLALEAALFEADGLGRFPDMYLRVKASRDVCKKRVLQRGKTSSYFDFLSQRAHDYPAEVEILNDGSISQLKKAFEKALSQITIGDKWNLKP